MELVRIDCNLFLATDNEELINNIKEKTYSLPVFNDANVCELATRKVLKRFTVKEFGPILLKRFVTAR